MKASQFSIHCFIAAVLFTPNSLLHAQTPATVSASPAPSTTSAVNASSTVSPAPPPDKPANLHFPASPANILDLVKIQLKAVTATPAWAGDPDLSDYDKLVIKEPYVEYAIDVAAFANGANLDSAKMFRISYVVELSDQEVADAEVQLDTPPSVNIRKTSPYALSNLNGNISNALKYLAAKDQVRKGSFEVRIIHQVSSPAITAVWLKSDAKDGTDFIYTLTNATPTIKRNVLYTMDDFRTAIQIDAQTMIAGKKAFDAVIATTPTVAEFDKSAPASAPNPDDPEPVRYVTIPPNVLAALKANSRTPFTSTTKVTAVPICMANASAIASGGGLEDAKLIGFSCQIQSSGNQNQIEFANVRVDTSGNAVIDSRNARDQVVLPSVSPPGITGIKALSVHDKVRKGHYVIWTLTDRSALYSIIWLRSDTGRNDDLFFSHSNVRSLLKINIEYSLDEFMPIIQNLSRQELTESPDWPSTPAK